MSIWLQIVTFQQKRVVVAALGVTEIEVQQGMTSLGLGIKFVANTS